MDDFRKIVYGVIIGFLFVVGGFIAFATLSSCGYNFNCSGAAPKVERTSIPTLIPATLPLPARFLATPFATAVASMPTGGGMQMPGAAPSEEDMLPSNPGGPGAAINLTGNIASGKQIFAANCAACHGAEGKGGVANPGSVEGTVPALNPVHSSLANPDYKTFATNLDLFIEHGSTPQGNNPFRSMPAWGDSGALTPQEIADVIAYIISLNK